MLGGEILVEIKRKIDRKQKDLMRNNLEKVLEKQKELDQLIAAYAEKSEIAEYQDFLMNMRSKNLENIKIVSRYMVTKCNR
jgi:uncharacterized membrane protein YgaE (UPF0421/DUF939 family)